MKSLMRLWAFLLIITYGAVLMLPAAALAATAPFPTCELLITPGVVQPGGSATLLWTSTNTDPTQDSITNVGNVPPSGSKQITPPLSQITTYVGSFTGPGGTANCTASVQVSYGSATGLVNPNPTAPITAAGGTGGITGGGTPQPAIVQCGIGAGIGNSTSCQACNLAQLVQNLINFAIGISFPIAAVLFAWAGVLYFTSGASPGNMEKAKGIFSNALVGFLIAITAWIIINTLLHTILNQTQFANGSWFSIQCNAAGTRPINLTIDKVINSVLSPVNNSLTSTTQLCPSTATYSPALGGCTDTTTGECTYSGCGVMPGVVGSGTQCSTGNCNSTYLQGLNGDGFETAAANAMACIAQTENSGSSSGCNGNACGTFQIMLTANPLSGPDCAQYNPTGGQTLDCPSMCSSAASASNKTNGAAVQSACLPCYQASQNAACNAESAQNLYASQGYSPWIGTAAGGYSSNTQALGCVVKYDPSSDSL